MGNKITVLGAGLVGSAIAIDLKKSGFDVTAVDLNKKRLQKLKLGYYIKAQLADFSDKKALSKVIAPADIVIGAVPGAFGFQVLKTVIEAGKNIVDISL